MVVFPVEGRHRAVSRNPGHPENGAMSVLGTKYALNSVCLKGRKLPHCRRSASRAVHGVWRRTLYMSQCPHWWIRSLSEQVQRTAALRPSGRNVLGAALVTMGSKRKFAAASTNVGIWHIAEVGAVCTEVR